MEQNQKSRGIDPKLENHWKFSIQKENKLRLKWFKKNEERLGEIANHEPMRKVPEEVINETKDKLVASFQNVKRHAVMPKDVEPPVIDEDALYHIMRPIDRETKDLLFSSTQPDGRRKYLKERCKVIPENRYYFTETTAFEYGWNMWNHTKTTPASKFARQQVIRDSFYRRRGVDKDPEWYKEPARLSPTVCGCI